MRLGIDFGTSYSSAALFLDNRLRAIKDPINLGYSFPSSVFLTPKGEMLVGYAAENKRQLKPDCYQREFKRELGSDFPYFLGSTKKMPEELVTEVIKKLKIEADKVAQGLGEIPLTQVILTIPATYEPKKRQLMRETCQRAGFEKIKLLEEPIAAGIYYSHFAKVPEDATILVYDLGGGTFDATLLKKGSSDYQLLGMPMGLPDCGGADFDRLIFQELLQQCSPSLQQKLKSPESKDFRNRIFPECFKLKHQLSEASEGEIWIPTGEAESFSLSRERFNEMIGGLVSETINCCDLLLTKTELSWSQIDRVLLVGGSCRIPYVREMVAQKWGKTPIQVDEPELAVCYGAAIYGASLELESPEYFLEKGLEQIQAGDYRSAIAEFDQAIRLDSNYAPAYCHRGLAHAQLNQTQAAFEDYDLAIRLERNYGEAYLHRGNLRCQSNDLKGAIEDYDRALFVNPELTEAAEKKELVFNQLSSVAQSQTTVAVDEDDLTSSIERMPEQGANHVVQVIRLDYSDPDNPMMIIKDPDHPEGQGMKVSAEQFMDAWENSGQYDDNQQTVEDDSEIELDAEQYLIEAQKLWEQGKAEKCILMLRKSIKRNPNCAEAYIYLVAALLHQGHSEEDVKVELQTALLCHDPRNPDTISNLNNVLRKIEKLQTKFKQGTSSKQTSPDSQANISSSKHKQKAQYWAWWCINTLKGHAGWFAGVKSVAFSPDGQILASGSDDKTIKLWRVSTGEEIRTIQNFDSVKLVAFSPDGKTLATADGSPKIMLWQVTTGKEICALNNEKNVLGPTCKSITFSSDGQMLASLINNNNIKIWQASNWKAIRLFKEPGDTITSVAFSPDDKLLGCCLINKITLWEVSTGNKIGTLTTDDTDDVVLSTVFSPDGKLLAGCCADDKIILWDVDSRKHIQTLTDHTNLFISVAFSPDGQILASGSSDNTIVLWEVSTGQKLFTLTGHTNNVTSVAFSPDGNLLASGSDDRTIKLWKPEYYSLD